MTLRDGFDRTVSEWLDEQAGHGSPDYLDDVLSRTTRTRQRPAWSSLERWLPVVTTVRLRLAPVPRAGWAFLVLALIFALTIALVIVPGGQPTVPPFGLAGNGRIAFSAELSPGSNTFGLFTADPDGSNVQRLAASLDGAFAPLFSPDGRRLAFWSKAGSGTALHHLMVMDTDGSNLVDVSGPQAYLDDENIADAGFERASWSPDSRRIAFSSPGAAGFGIGAIRIWSVNADGSGLTAITDTSSDREPPAWSPDGTWIVFLKSTIGGDEQVLWVIHSDGTGEQQLGPQIKVSLGGETQAVAWAPDPNHLRLLYTRADDAPLTIATYDFATRRESVYALGFWPSWSPDATRIAWWDGDVAIAAAPGSPELRGGIIHPDVGFSSCAVTTRAADPAICSGVVWSPDGTKIIGHDVQSGSLLIETIDGSRPIESVPLSGATGLVTSWQRVAP